MQKHSIKRNRLTQFSISTFLIAVTVCSLIVFFASNWEPITHRMKYGRPVDMSTVSIDGLGEGLILRIGKDHVVTEKSWRMDQIMSSALSGDLEINGVWKNRDLPGQYTIKIGDRYFQARPNNSDPSVTQNAR